MNELTCNLFVAVLSAVITQAIRVLGLSTYLGHNGARVSPAPEHRCVRELHKAAPCGAVADRVRLVGVQDSPCAAAVDAAGPSLVAAAALPEGFGLECLDLEVPGPEPFAHEAATAVRYGPAEVEQLGSAHVAAAAAVSRFCAAAISARNGGTFENPRAAVAPVGSS